MLTGPAFGCASCEWLHSQDLLFYLAASRFSALGCRMVPAAANLIFLQHRMSGTQTSLAFILSHCPFITSDQTKTWDILTDLKLQEPWLRLVYSVSSDKNGEGVVSQRKFMCFYQKEKRRMELGLETQFFFFFFFWPYFFLPRKWPLQFTIFFSG